MKNLRNCVIALTLGCCMPILIWVGAGNALYEKRRRADLLREAVRLIASPQNSSK